MATLNDSANFATDPSVLPPLMAGMAQAAVQIMAEAGTTPFHDQRVALATAVIRNPSSLASAFAWAVSTNTTVVDEWVSDNRTGAVNDLPFTISSVWNAVAGAAAPSTP